MIRIGFFTLLFLMPTILYLPTHSEQRASGQDAKPLIPEKDLERFLAQAQPQQPNIPFQRYATGHKTPANIAELHRLSWIRHGHHLKSLPKATPATFDCIEMGWVGPIKDQSQCGSCWDFSGTGMVECACIKVGLGKNDGSFQLSEQYTLDGCVGNNGGCDGDDNSTVLNEAKSKGLPTTADYGPYEARSHRCAYTSNMKLYQIADWGYCAQQDGVASVQSIKDAMSQYGPIGCAIAADNAFMNVRPGEVFQGSATDINHDIILVGWDDSKGAWKLRNSWGKSWCDGGYCWIKYGANQVGTSANWCRVIAPVPPPGPAPNPNPPPGPVSPQLVTTGFSGRTVTMDFGNNSLTPPAGETWNITGKRTIDVSQLDAKWIAFMEGFVKLALEEKIKDPAPPKPLGQEMPKGQSMSYDDKTGKWIKK